MPLKPQHLKLQKQETLIKYYTFERATTFKACVVMYGFQWKLIAAYTKFHFDH